MIIIPQLQPQLLTDMETNFGSTIATAIWAKMIEHINWIQLHVPIGMILMVHKNKTGPSVSWPTITIPNSWQFCDGSLITNPDSPLFNQNVPDLRNLFLKHSDIIGQTGGADSINLYHNHSGSTGTTDDSDFSAKRTDDGDEVGKYNHHSHGISGDLGTYTKVPPFHELQPYMRIV